MNSSSFDPPPPIDLEKLRLCYLDKQNDQFQQLLHHERFCLTFSNYSQKRAMYVHAQLHHTVHRSSTSHSLVNVAVHWLRVGAMVQSSPNLTLAAIWLGTDSARTQRVSGQRVLIAAHVTFSDDCANAKPVYGSHYITHIQWKFQFTPLRILGFALHGGNIGMYVTLLGADGALMSEWKAS